MRKLIVIAIILITGWLYLQDLSHQFGVSDSGLEQSQSTRLAQAAPTEALRSILIERNAISTAQDYLESHRQMWNLQSHHEFRPEEMKLPIGSRVHFSVWQEGVPITGLGFNLLVGKDLSVTELDRQYVPVEKADLKNAFRVSPSVYRATADAQFTAKILYLSPGSLKAEPAYVIPVGNTQIVIKASDGELLGREIGRSEF